MREQSQTVYLAFGGNLSNSLDTLKKSIEHFSEAPEFSDLECSSIYRTRAVSPIPQADYYNAVCRLQCTLEAEDLLRYIERLEKSLGQARKAKNAPRLIDIDILFYGQESHCSAFLEIPHPRWRERLFVLTPLSDVVESLEIPRNGGGMERVHLPSLLESFDNPHDEKVELHEQWERTLASYI